MSQEKTIRFIDTNYRTLFTLPDGRITLDRDAIDHLDGKAISLSEFQKQQALQRRPPLLKRLREPRPAQTGRKPAKAVQER